MPEAARQPCPDSKTRRSLHSRSSSSKALTFGRYHWALIVGPKNESSSSRGSVFNAKESLSIVGNPPVAQSVWNYEERATTMAPASMLLVRILIGKVASLSRLRSVFERTPLRPQLEGWNCVGWVREAFLAAIADGRALGTSASDWEAIRDVAMWYVQAKKAAHRFDGTVSFDPNKAPTWDMLKGAERMP